MTYISIVFVMVTSSSPLVKEPAHNRGDVLINDAPTLYVNCRQVNGSFLFFYTEAAHTSHEETGPGKMKIYDLLKRSTILSHC